MSRGIIEAQTLRTEQFEFEARTSDPADAQPGEYWFRVDQTSTNPDVIAELRRQDTSGVTTCPIFAASEESNLGTDVTRGPSVVLDDGSVGFIVMATGRGAVGSPRAVNSAGTQYVSHNALELSPIPDSGVSRWQFEQDVTDLWDGNDGTNNGATFVSDAKVGYYALDFDGTDDYVSVGDKSNLKSFSKFSVTVWAKPSSNQDGGLGKWDFDAGDFEYLLRTDSGNDAWHGDLADSNGNVTSVEGGTVAEEEYQFVAMRWDGSTYYLDVDDTQVDSKAASFAMNTSNQPFYIGRYGSSYYDGIFDDPRVYSKYLSDIELKNLRTTGSISG